MNKKLLLIPLFILILLENTMAHCPLCTGAAVAGVAGARYLGLDVSLVGIFTGAFAISLALWINRKSKIYFRYQKQIVIILSFLLTIIPVIYSIKDTIYIPLFLYGGYGSLLNRIYSINKFLLGSVIGGIITLFAYYIHTNIKIKYNRILFPYQGIVLTMALLILASIPLYIILS